MDVEIRRGLYGLLAGDSTLTSLLATATSIYDGVAPQGAAFPYLILQLQDGQDEYSFASRAWEDMDWQVRAVDRSTSGTVADQIAARVDTVLTDGSITITGRTPLHLRRQRVVRYWEVEDGQQYVHVAGEYRLVVA